MPESPEPQEEGERTSRMILAAQQQFISTLEALYELLNRVSPHVEALDSMSRVMDVIEPSAQTMSQSERQEFERVLGAVVRGLKTTAAEDEHEEGGEKEPTDTTVDPLSDLRQIHSP